MFRTLAVAAASLAIAGSAVAQEPGRYRVDAEVPMSDGQRMALFTDVTVGGRTDVAQAGPDQYAMTAELRDAQIDGGDAVNAQLHIARGSGADAQVLAQPSLTFRPGTTASMTVDTDAGPITVRISPSAG